MSTQSSNIEKEYYQQGIPMIPLKYISRLAWDSELGERLKQARGKVSRRELAEKLQSAGHDCSHQNLQKIEDGRAQSVPLDLVLAVCQALEVELGQIIPIVTIGIQQPENFITRG